MRIAVLGAGAFGTALAVHLKRLAHEVIVWTRSAAKASQIPGGVNHEALPAVDFDPGLRASVEMEEALRGVELAILAAPRHLVQALDFVHANPGPLPVPRAGGRPVLGSRRPAGP